MTRPLTEYEKGDALIRFFYKTEPDGLDLETWAQRVNEITTVLGDVADRLSVAVGRLFEKQS